MASDDDVDLAPHCETCGRDVDIYKAVVSGTQPDGRHEVHEFELECGHVLDDPDATMPVSLVYLLSETRPHTIEVDGEIDEDRLDQSLDQADDLGWRGYFWELLGMLAAVYIVARERYRAAKYWLADRRTPTTSPTGGNKNE